MLFGLEPKIPETLSKSLKLCENLWAILSLPWSSLIYHSTACGWPRLCELVTVTLAAPAEWGPGLAMAKEIGEVNGSDSGRAKPLAMPANGLAIISGDSADVVALVTKTF